MKLLISRYWKQALAGAIVAYLSFQIAIEANHLTSASPICPYSDEHYPNWYWNTCYSACGGCAFVWCVLVLKFLQLKDHKQSVPFLVTLCIVSMALLSTILSLTINWGGVCKDVFG